MTDLSEQVKINIPSDSIVLEFKDGYCEKEYFKQWWQLVGERLFDAYWKAECERVADDDIPF